MLTSITRSFIDQSAWTVAVGVASYPRLLENDRKRWCCVQGQKTMYTNRLKTSLYYIRIVEKEKKCVCKNVNKDSGTFYSKISRGYRQMIKRDMQNCYQCTRRTCEMRNIQRINNSTFLYMNKLNWFCPLNLYKNIVLICMQQHCV